MYDVLLSHVWLHDDELCSYVHKKLGYKQVRTGLAEVTESRRPLDTETNKHQRDYKLSSELGNVFKAT